MPKILLRDLQQHNVVSQRIAGGQRSDIVGAGIADAISIGASRNDNPPATRSILKSYGAIPIVAMVVFRTPLDNILHKALNILTFGSWDDVRKKYGFDDLFHLGIIATLANNKQVLIEKNENIKISFGFTQKTNTEIRNVPIPMRKGYDLTMERMLNDAERAVGTTNQFHYNAFISEYDLQRPQGGNCQAFITSLLQYSGMLTPDLRKFIQQDVQSSLKDLPGYTQALVEKATNALEIINIAVDGKGLSRRKV